jgi:drug/metabolite transporter (DMT)-like permease
MALGYLLAVLATLASGSGSILESMGVRRAGAYGGRSLDLIALRRQWLYFCGLGVNLLGFACSSAALHRLPLFLVQSMLAFSVGVTAMISAFMGTRLRAPGWGALVVGATGLVLLGVSAEPGRAQALPPQWRWILVAAAVPVAAIAVYARRHNLVWATVALAFGSGVAYSVVGISARTLHLPDVAWRLVLEPAAWAIVLNGCTAAVLFAMALQKGGPTGVTAIMFTTNTALSSFVGLVYLGDQVREGYFVAATIGFVLAIAGAIAVAHYSADNRQKDRTATPAGVRV